MPIDENATPGVGTTPQTPMQDGQTPGAVSDLGDILMDQSLDKVEKGDFVPVSKNDIPGFGEPTEEEDEDPFAKPTPTNVESVPMPEEDHATLDDLHNMEFDAPVVESPFEVQDSEVKDTADIVSEEPTSDVLDLGDISLTPEAESAPVDSPVEAEIPIEEVTPVVEEVAPAIIDTPVEDNTFDMSFGDTSLTPEVENASVDSPVEVDVPTEEVNAENAVEDNALDINLDDTSLTPEAESTPVDAPVEEDVPVEEDNFLDMNLDSVTPEAESASVETPVEDVVPVMEDAPTEDSSLSSEIESPTIENPVEAVPPMVDEIVTDTTPIETSDISSEGVVENIVEAPVQEITPEAAALEKVANEVSQGIDLDSLMTDTSTNNSVPTNDTIATQTPAEGIKAMVSSGTAGQKKKLLLIIGAALLVGLIVLGASMFTGGGDSTNIVTPTPIESTGDNNIIDESIVTDTGEDTGTIEEATGDTTGEVNTGTDTETTIEQPTPKTKVEIQSIATDLSSKVRKALIKATIVKNMELRQSAFDLQKEIETFIQTLENTSDITTLSDSEIKVNELSQRLDSILQILNGNSQ